MSISDPEKVTNPMQPPTNFNAMLDPHWKCIGEVQQLIDPTIGQGRAIGYWDCVFNLPFFFGKGFLKVDPSNPKTYTFVYDPKDSPFKEEKRECFIFNNERGTYI